jgi:5-methylcytosine-specific restriction endonuclease McrA
MTNEQITWVRDLVQKGKTYWFYVSRTWKRVRREVLTHDKGECQQCKRRGRYAPATVVHHRFHLEEYPQYALDEYVTIDGVEQRNLESWCRPCHEEEHDYRHEVKQPLNEERW